MRCFKTVLVSAVAVLTMAALSVTAFAADYTTPAEAVAGLTGQTVEEVIAQRAESGKTYGELAKDADKLNEFKEACLAMKKDTLNEQVKNGVISQTEADEIIAAVAAYQAACDGTGPIDGNYGAGYCVGGAGCVGYGYHHHNTSTTTNNSNNGTGYGAGYGYGYGGGCGMGRGGRGGHHGGGHGCW